MEKHKYLENNGIEFKMSAQDLVSADLKDVAVAEGKRFRNIQGGWR